MRSVVVKICLLALIGLLVQLLMYVTITSHNTLAIHQVPSLHGVDLYTNATLALHQVPELPKMTFTNISSEFRELLSKPPNFKISYIYSQAAACSWMQANTGTQNQSNITSLQSKTYVNPHRHIDILFVVPSAYGNVKRRKLVRASDLYSFTLNPVNKAKLLFFLGSPDYTQQDAAKVQTTIDAEVNQHGDIVQGLYTDAYRLILLKAVSMLHWTSTFCTTAKYVIRTDDDVIINVTRLVSAIHEVGKKESNFILAGHLVHNPTDPQLRVYRKGKYAVSEEEFPHPTWPPFALGGLLGYPTRTVRLLYEAAVRLTPVWLDDVFITGICGRKVNASLVTHKDFSFIHNLKI